MGILDGNFFGRAASRVRNAARQVNDVVKRVNQFEQRVQNTITRGRQTIKNVERLADRIARTGLNINNPENLIKFIREDADGIIDRIVGDRSRLAFDGIEDIAAFIRSFIQTNPRLRNIINVTPSEYSLSIPDYTALLGSEGVALTSQYWVEIYPPVGVAIDDIRKVSMMCVSAELPSRQFLTTEEKHTNFNKKLPYQQVFDDINLTFILSGDLKQKDFFDNWMNKVVDEKTGSLNFYNEYVGELYIHQLDSKGVPTYSVRVKDAYPTATGKVNFAYDDTNNISRLDVTITYKNWERFL